MGNLQKIGVLLAFLSVGVGCAGYAFYRQCYKKPRAALAEQRAQLQAQIAGGKQQTEQMEQRATQYLPVYRRSFPTNPTNARLEYQIWLSQMLDFCNIKNAKVEARSARIGNASPTQTHVFVAQGQCSLVDLTQFLYEFYWTPFLHRITALDIQPQDNSQLLNVKLTIEGLTIRYQAPGSVGPNNAPTVSPTKLPSLEPAQRFSFRRLASGPFAAYKPLGDVELFRAVRTGVDSASFTTLIGVPIIADESGKSIKFSRWRIETDGKTLSLKIGDRITVGSFDGYIADVSEELELVVLKQASGRVWAVPLGRKLSDAVAIPENLF